MLQHEQKWVNWKASGCKPYEMAAVDLKPSKKRKRVNSSMAINTEFMGNEELSRLWTHGANIEDSLRKNAARFLVLIRSSQYIKPFDKMVSEASKQLSDDLSTGIDGIEDEYLIINQPSFSWLMFRVASQNNLAVFDGAKIDGKNMVKSLIKSWRNTTGVGNVDREKMIEVECLSIDEQNTNTTNSVKKARLE